MGYDRAALKRGARQAMRATSSRPMLVTLAFNAIVSVGTMLINGVLGWLFVGKAVKYSDMMLYYVQQGYEMEEAMEQAMLMFLGQGPGAIFGATVGAAALSLLIALWQSSMGVGYEGYCLSMVRHENPPLNKVFCALPQFGEVLVTRVLTGVFLVLWTLLVSVGWFAVVIAGMVLALAVESELVMGLVMLLSIPAMWACAAWVTLRYALVDYVLLDKGLTGLDAIRESKRLMKGNISKGFVLQLSFFGWYLLLIVLAYAVLFAVIMAFAVYLYSMGAGGGTGVSLLLAAAALIGMAILGLWLKPYTTSSWAMFYDWAKGRVDGGQAGPGFGGGAGGWSEHTDYTWSAGPTSGTGTGTGPAPGGGGTPDEPAGNSGTPAGPSRWSPRPPRDDPWE